MGKELIIVHEAIDTTSEEVGVYEIKGIEVLDGNYKDASMFSVIMYKGENGWITSSPRAWYKEIDKLIEEYIQTNKFYNENFK